MAWTPGVEGNHWYKRGLVTRRFWSQSQANKVRIFPIQWPRPIGFFGLPQRAMCHFLLSLHPLSLLAVSFPLGLCRWFSHALSDCVPYLF